MPSRVLQPVTPLEVIAFYLPQYSPNADNDDWWGPGFTEWTNVASARRLYPGHYQPHLPGELGFYDLRLAETRADQASLARAHGVTAFCYWHYWFAGRRILDRVLEDVASSGEPDFPFCLGWANASWSTRWDMGSPTRTLLEQTYPGDDDHRRHFAAIEHLLHDPRYVRCAGRPLVYLYRPTDIPDLPGFLELWRSLAQASGLGDLYFVGEVRPGSLDPGGTDDLDAHLGWSFPPRRLRWDSEGRGAIDAWLSEATHRTGVAPAIFSYAHWLRYFPYAGDDERRVYLPCVLPNWDNTPRMGRSGIVLHGSNPGLFRQQVDLALSQLAAAGGEPKVLFVRSWNEWAEGNHLEPDRRFGRGYLEALRDAIRAESDR